MLLICVRSPVTRISTTQWTSPHIPPNFPAYFIYQRVFKINFEILETALQDKIQFMQYDKLGPLETFIYLSVATTPHLHVIRLK